MMSFFEARHYHMQVSQDEGRNEINVTVYLQPDFHYTRKNSQAATNLKLLTNCVRTACFKSLEQVWNKPLTTGGLSDLLQDFFNKTETFIYTVTMLQPCVVNFVTIMLPQVCIGVGGKTLQQMWYSHQACYKLSTSLKNLLTIWYEIYEHNLRTAC